MKRFASFLILAVILAAPLSVSAANPKSVGYVHGV